jgi:hypothetical protein
MVKSRRKLKAMKVAGKVYDPIARNPTCAPRIRICANSRELRIVNIISMGDLTGPKRKVLKNGTRRVIYK